MQVFDLSAGSSYLSDLGKDVFKKRQSHMEKARSAFVQMIFNIRRQSLPQPGTLSEVLGPISQSVTNNCTGGRCDSAGYRITHGVQLCCVAILLFSTMVYVL